MTEVTTKAILKEFGETLYETGEIFERRPAATALISSSCAAFFTYLSTVQQTSGLKSVDEVMALLSAVNALRLLRANRQIRVAQRA